LRTSVVIGIVLLLALACGSVLTPRHDERRFSTPRTARAQATARIALDDVVRVLRRLPRERGDAPIAYQLLGFNPARHQIALSESRLILPSGRFSEQALVILDYESGRTIERYRGPREFVRERIPRCAERNWARYGHPVGYQAPEPGCYTGSFERDALLFARIARDMEEVPVEPRMHGLAGFLASPTDELALSTELWHRSRLASIARGSI
jgi:hypothetical protein